MNKSILHFIFIGLVCMMCLYSCAEKENNGVRLSSYCGHYTVESIFWAGEFVDVNGDGIASRDLLIELDGQPGFVPGWIEADVTLCQDGISLSYDCAIPAVVIREYPESSIYSQTIMYHGVQIISTWHPDWGTPSFTSGVYNSRLDAYTYGINRAYLNNVSDSSFELCADCVLLNVKDNRIVEGVVRFTFKKQ